MMAPVAAKLFIAQPALPVLLLLLHGSVLPVQDFQRLATTRHCQILKELSTCGRPLGVTVQRHNKHMDLHAHS